MKSLLVAGTVAAGLSASVFCLPVSAAGTAINTGNIATLATYDDTQKTYTLTSGEYELGEDLNLSDDSRLVITGNVSIDLNSHTIKSTHTPVVEVTNTGAFTLSGTGGINGSLYTSGTLTINGGTYGSMTGGGAININDGANVTINDGTFQADASSAIYIMNYANATNIVINGGTFTSNGDYGIQAEIEPTTSSIEIKGGTFTGAKAGLGIMGPSSVFKLSGGTFNSGASGVGAIEVTAPSGAATAETINTMLVSGYKYSDATINTGTNYGMSAAFLTAKSVTVESKTTTPTTTNTTTGGSGTVNEGKATNDSKVSDK
ncbi:MAG: hypothetical protein Q4A25_02350, partial [Candidatus Saccharibacteria bacterium]|nr:hypothetical protein [Candidatus Saccharibacteria bacterium]